MGKRKRRGQSYEKRIADINRIYDQYARSGLPNREIWRRYIYPAYGVSERTFYNLLNASALHPSCKEMSTEGFLFKDFFEKEDEQRRADYYQTHPDGPEG